MLNVSVKCAFSCNAQHSDLHYSGSDAVYIGYELCVFGTCVRHIPSVGEKIPPWTTLVFGIDIV